jgi:SAM-dependent methyltransferase
MEASVAVAGDVEFVSACPVCHGRSFTRLPVPGRWVGPEVFGDLSSQLGLVRCRACSLVFTNPRPSATRLATFYSGDTYVCHEEDASHFARNKADLLLGKLGELMPAAAPRTLLDYGAGAGGFLVHARTRGWDVKGFEPGKRGLEACRRANLDVTNDLRSVPSRAFGLITLQHVFEHLADPAATLQSLRTYLAPEGRLYIEVPNAHSLRAAAAASFLSRRFAVDERYRAFPVHLMYYRLRTLGTLLESCGWTVECAFTLGIGLDRFIIPRRVNEPVAACDVTPRRAGRTPLRRAKHLVRDAFLGLGLGENLSVIARL